MIFRYFKVRWYFDISINFKLEFRANPFLQPRLASPRPSQSLPPRKTKRRLRRPFSSCSRRSARSTLHISDWLGNNASRAKWIQELEDLRDRFSVFFLQTQTHQCCTAALGSGFSNYNLNRRTLSIGELSELRSDLSSRPWSGFFYHDYLFFNYDKKLRWIIYLNNWHVMTFDDIWWHLMTFDDIW